jgi:recombination protein RecA
VRLDIRRTGQLKNGDEIYGSRARVKVVKNKVAPPFRQAEFEILYGTGVNQLGELVDLGATHGVLEKSGAWYLLDGERIGQGREKALAFLSEHADIRLALRDRLMSAMRAIPTTVVAGDESATEVAA